MKSIKTNIISSLTKALFLTMLLLTNCKQKTDESVNLQSTETFKNLNLVDMKSQVFTTAHNSELKLTLTDTIEFGLYQQPKEVDAAIIVDYTKQFQTFLGIGAALTDASAETYFKLPEDKQNKFMEAYYNIDKGIGYSLARTQIHRDRKSVG